MPFLAVDTLPQLRNRHIRLSRLIVHLQIPAVETQRHVITEPVIVHIVQQPLRISLRPVLHIFVRMIQITCAVEIITGIVRSAVCIGRVIAAGFRVREALVVPADMLLRQCPRTIRVEIIRPEIAPIGQIAAMV